MASASPPAGGRQSTSTACAPCARTAGPNVSRPTLTTATRCSTSLRVSPTVCYPPPLPMSALERLAETVRADPTVQAKRELAIVRRIGIRIDGDDGAAIEHRGEFLIMCGEAIIPS